ncbi:aspartyl-phosphate phosphatase Spo0E family protein [Sediminibacillus massiliensis]|uniref:aspartyl-phosphate phosphatase Spo0E family protein n=1 Tax=Sediminibacillus massiliensis TaxID=1926277 RepID=UPI00098836BC|nr:aspartyl-phosphate phosphatase Spo0E family protein [Sediminibacillus massiliensis]
MNDTQLLLVKIELLRNKMTEVALKKGFSSAESVSISQELDQLLNLYDTKKQIKPDNKQLTASHHDNGI